MNYDKEQKDLLIKDLSSRLPYNLVVQIEGCGIWNLRGIDHDDSAELRDRAIVWHGKNYHSSKNSFPIINCKPFLFPLSSMTEEQWNNAPRVNLTEFTFESLKCGCFTLASYTCDNDLHDLVEFINWLIENHFDIYGLIPMGLALDATNLNIY